MLHSTPHLKGDLYGAILESQADLLRTLIKPSSSIEQIWADLVPHAPTHMRIICTRGFIYSTKALICSGTSADNGHLYNLFLIYRVSFHLL